MACKVRVTFTLSFLTLLVWGCGSSPTDTTKASATNTLQPEPDRALASTVAPLPTTSEGLPQTPEAGAMSAPSLTPTLGPQVTRTPGQAAECPEITSGKIELTSSAPGVSVVDIFEQQLLTYLNSGGGPSTLQEALSDLTMLDGAWEARAQVEMVDVTGNTTPEVLIDLSFFEAGQYFEGGLFVFRCEDGSYVGGALFSTAGQVQYGGEPDGILGILDMNNDGIPEIVHSHISIAGTHGYFTREFRILEWDGQEFVDLIPEVEYGFYAQADTGDGVIEDFDGNGTKELILSNSLGEAYPDLGPQRSRTDIWAWNGYQFVPERWEYTEPEFRIHAIWDGDDATRYGDYAKALAFYQQGIFDTELFGWTSGQLWPDWAYDGGPTPEPDPEEWPRLNAYGRYRIMLLHAIQGYQPEAQIVYDTLQENFPDGAVGSQYAKLARIFWEEYSSSGDVELACAKTVEFAESQSSIILIPLGKRFYGNGQREYTPEDICPFR